MIDIDDIDWVKKDIKKIYQNKNKDTKKKE